MTQTVVDLRQLGRRSKCGDGEELGCRTGQCIFPAMVRSMTETHILQMLEFKMANAAAGTTISARSSAYKTVPERSTRAPGPSQAALTVCSVPPLRPRHPPARTPLLDKGQKWEGTAAGERHKARGSEDVRRELGEYLEEPLETFSRTEQVDGAERRVVFDLLTYWQGRATFSISYQRL